MFHSFFLLFAIFPFILAAPLDRQPRTTIPLSKRANRLYYEDGSVNIEALTNHVALATGKFLRGVDAYERNTGNTHLLHSNKIRARSVSEVPLTDDSNILWQGDLTVGTPPVTYSVDFDTGSSDLFLPSSSCGATCQGHTRYDPASSSSARSLSKAFSLSFGDGSTVSGTQFQDTVSIAGLTAKVQTVGAATEYSAGFEAPGFQPDGLMGLGFQSISEFNASPVFQTLVSDGQTTDAVFAMKLTGTGAELTLGGVNQQLFTGQPTFVPVEQEGFWQIQFDAATVGNKKVVGAKSCIVDSGTTLVIGDTQSVTNIYSQIPGAQDAGQGMFAFPCDATLPDVAFTLGGKSFSMTDSLSFGPLSSGSNECMGSIIAADLGNEFFILGDAFMTNVYTVFDVANSQVGFATLA